jgi:lichenan operon transcriptional antiterminator
MSISYKNKQVIKILLEADEMVTASSLADKIGVSPRTVINYIGEINFFHSNLIESSRYGYSINKIIGKKLYYEKQGQLPQTTQERINCLLEKLLLHSSPEEAGVNLEYFAEDIFISLETAKKDLTKLKHKLAKLNLQVNINTYYVTLTGSERAKRNLLSNIIYENFDKNKISDVSIKQIFPDAKIDELYDLIMEQCKKHHYFINDCLIMNLILDILINISRIQQGCTINENNPSTKKQYAPTRDFAKNIAAGASNLYQLPHSEAEVEYLCEIILGYIMPADFKTMNLKQIKHFIEPESSKVLEHLFAYIRKNFSFINLENENFLIRFSLNINNLLCRLKNGHWSNNPQKEDMKHASPFTFKCGAGIAEEMSQLLGLSINEDDIAYLSLHLGINLIEQKDHDLEKICCGLMITHYFDYDEELIRALRQRFSNDIIISDIFRTEKLLPDFKDISLLISTVPLPETFKIEWVTTDPFLSENILAKIQKRICIKKLQKKQRILHDELLQIGSELLFYRNKAQEQLSLPNTISTIMQNLLVANGYIGAPDAASVINLHKNMPTIFGHIAVPNIIYTNVKKTGMVVVINERPPLWNNSQIDIVIMLALNPGEWELTQYAFDLLINVLCEIDNLRKVVNCKDYQSFVSTIVNLVE